MNSEQIVATREEILARMVAFFRPQPEVIALFVSGSLAEGTADEYSDIDFRVVVASDTFGEFIRNHMSFPQAWGDFMCNNGGYNVSVSHFRPFNKVDIFYYRPEDLKPSPWFTLPIEIIHDPQGVIQELVTASEKLPFKPSADDVSNSISIAIGNAHEVFRRAQRGELVYAQAILGRLRESIIEAEDALNQRPMMGNFGCSHFERRASDTVRQQLYASYVPADKRQILLSLSNLLDLYRSQIEQLHKAFCLRRDLRSDLDAIDVVTREG